MPPNAGKGRKKGTPNKVTGELRSMILGAVDSYERKDEQGKVIARGGRAFFEDQRDEHPEAFMILVGKCVPKEIKAEITSMLRVQLNGRGVAPDG